MAFGCQMEFGLHNTYKHNNMKTTALIEKGKDGTFTIFTSELESTIIGEGNTVDEAKKSFLKSIDEIIDFYKEDGLKLPEELKNVSFDFKYDIRLLFLL